MALLCGSSAAAAACRDLELGLELLVELHIVVPITSEIMTKQPVKSIPPKMERVCLALG